MSSENIDITQNKSKDKVEELIQNILDRNELIETESKQLRSDTKKLIKSIQRQHTKSKTTSKNLSNKPASGFAKPSIITDELCNFLNKEVGTEMARTQVTKELNDYIKEHNLQNPDKKTFIDPDEKLKKLLKVNKSFTYFELQKHMSPLFPKKK